MESNVNQDLVALAPQIQLLMAIMEELTRQNQEMRQGLQQEDNHSETNRDDDRDSHKRQPSTLEGANSDLLKEIDELRNAIRGKTDQSLDRMVRKIDSPFTLTIQECLVPLKFYLPQLEAFDELKDPLDHLNTFKTTLGLQQPPDEILCRSFPTTLKGATREWFTKLPTSSIDNFEQLGSLFLCHFISG